jgi:hypothetical protein
MPADDTLPCRHIFSQHVVDRVKRLLMELETQHPEDLARTGVPAGEWQPFLRAAVESLRGSWAASTTDKYRFIAEVLKFGATRKAWKSWAPVGTAGRNDFRVELNDGTLISIEAKGCPDGNNTNIWDRPGWADEFFVWCQCPESLRHHPGTGAWAGIANRLLPKVAAERTVVDGFIFWDGRCGSKLRPCPKGYGVDGLRSAATDIPGQSGREDWVPPPCIFMMPKSPPHVSNNRVPAVHNIASLKFAAALLDVFNVPASEQPEYVHDAKIAARNVPRGTEVQVTVRSRCWPDGVPRVEAGNWKPLRRE